MQVWLWSFTWRRLLYKSVGFHELDIRKYGKRPVLSSLNHSKKNLCSNKVSLHRNESIWPFIKMFYERNEITAVNKKQFQTFNEKTIQNYVYSQSNESVLDKVRVKKKWPHWLKDFSSYCAPIMTSFAFPNVRRFIVIQIEIRLKKFYFVQIAVGFHLFSVPERSLDRVMILTNSSFFCQFLEDEKVNVLEWSPRSTNLNPIENVWAKMQILVKRHMLRKRVKNRNQLFSLCESVFKLYVKKWLKSCVRAFRTDWHRSFRTK